MNLFNAKLSPGQVLALYTQMSQGTNLRLVSMGHVDIRHVVTDSNVMIMIICVQWGAPRHY